MTKGEYNIVLVSEGYFEKYNTIFTEMLDVSDTRKQAKRLYINTLLGF